MFTGIVRMTAAVTRLNRSEASARIAIDLGRLAEDLGRGDSVCVDGACLTVASQGGTVCEFDAVPETMARTTLADRRAGDRVNIEPSLRVGDPLGGHFVLGHVDGVGVIERITPAGAGSLLRVNVAPALTAEMVAKGSVAVDGISLTLVEVGETYFICALIPTTLADTTLGGKAAGARVNVETDILGKFAAKHLAGAPRPPSGLTMDRLRDAGFV